MNRIESSDPARLHPSPTVSVVMLAYRHEDFIDEAIEGVMRQDFDEGIELLVGEDCSPDRTLEIALSHQARNPDRIRVFSGPRNVGVIANSTELIRAARGDFVAFCEGDDFWHRPDKLRLQVQALRADPDAQLCHTDYDRRFGRWTLGSMHRRRGPRHLAAGDAYANLLEGMTVKTPTAVYRGSFLRAFVEGEFNRADWPFGDYPKALLASVHGPITYVPDSTATYRYRPGSAMNSGRLARFRMGQSLAECREVFMRAYPVPDAVALRARRTGRIRQMQDGFMMGDEEAYRAGHAWLLANGFKPGRLRHLACRLALRTAWPLRLLQFAQDAFLKAVAAATRTARPSR